MKTNHKFKEHILEVLKPCKELWSKELQAVDSTQNTKEKPTTLEPELNQTLLKNLNKLVLIK